jgi:carboxyl-terminal processing protease
MKRLLLVAVFLLAAGCASKGPIRAEYDRDSGMETFDAAWRIVYETHFDTTFNGVNWVALRDELRPRAMAAESRAQLRSVIRDMVDRLGQSHFALFPQETVDTPDIVGSESDAAEGGETSDLGDLGMDVRLVEGQVVVSQVESGGPAASAGIRPGWVLQAIDDDQMGDLQTRLGRSESKWPLAFRMWSAVLAQLQGSAGEAVRLTLLDQDDAPVEIQLTRRPDPSRPVKFGNMPTFFARFASRKVAAPDGGEVGVIWFNFWMVQLTRQVDSAVHAYRDLDGMVIDLRGNRGGVGAMVMGVSGHFFDQRVSLGTFRTRTATLRIVANPRRSSPSGERVEPFAGPVAVLIDEGSGSASEMFAGGVQSVGRMRVFGSRTLGGVLPASFDRLPNGDVLYHAFAEFVTADGTLLEGRGVIPDQEVLLTRPDLLAGRDPALEAALEWIASQ